MARNAKTPKASPKPQIQTNTKAIATLATLLLEQARITTEMVAVLKTLPR